MTAPAGMQVVALPTPGVVGGRPRKEPLMDTEVIVGGGATAVPTEVVIFSNFAQFRAAPNNANVTQTKQFGRDTDLKSSGGGTLPQSTFFYWYRWRQIIKTYLTDMADEANQIVWEEIARLRNLGSATFQFSQTDLIVLAMDELPTGIGVPFVQSTWTGATVMPPVNGAPGDGKDVTVSGRPVQIDALQQFSVSCKWPQTSGLLPLVDLFVSQRLDGLLIRGLVG